MEQESKTFVFPHYGAQVHIKSIWVKCILSKFQNASIIYGGDGNRDRWRHNVGLEACPGGEGDASRRARTAL
jgi:hypothetical protein